MPEIDIRLFIGSLGSRNLRRITNEKAACLTHPFSIGRQLERICSRNGSLSCLSLQSVKSARSNEAAICIDGSSFDGIDRARPHFKRSFQACKYVLFLRELIANPRSVGAACPSSKGLAKTMASFIPEREDGYIVEVGAGTGVVTSAILERGIDPSRLVVVEISKNLVMLLRKLFPAVNVVHGSAVMLKDHLVETLGPDSARVSTIVSSLPLRSLSDDLVHEIKNQFREVLQDYGRLIHFTYALKSNRENHPKAFQKVNSKIRWMNLPPARVEVFRRRVSKNRTGKPICAEPLSSDRHPFPN
jgi:phosphatidylethanolamine/phosphatidyl-N-methylethanolamine N-methyltransferase